MYLPTGPDQDSLHREVSRVCFFFLIEGFRGVQKDLAAVVLFLVCALTRANWPQSRLDMRGGFPRQTAAGSWR